MSTAVLFNDDDLLMMKRSPHRTISPGLWAAVGGHLEPCEISNPKVACLREIYEETGMNEENITNLNLQYILIRQKDREIRQQFVYIGQATTRYLPFCEEGELHWIHRNEVFNREIPFVYKSLLLHYFQHGPTSHVWIGTIHLSEQELTKQPQITWSPLSDPLVN